MQGLQLKPNGFTQGRIRFAALMVVTILSALWARYALGPSPLDIHDTHWISNDLADFYVVWSQYLNDPHAHWLSTDRLSYPLPMSVSMFDPMPLLLLLSRPIAWLVPSGTQFFGCYFLACLILQGIFGYLAVVQVLKLEGEPDSPWRTYAGAIGGLIIATIPFTFFRFQYHVSLSSQWVLVLSIWVALRTLDVSRRRWIVENSAVMFLATGLNPYLAFMVALNNAIIVAAQFRRIGWLDVAVRVSSLAIASGIGLYVFGFTGGAAVAGAGYGGFSMNALGPIGSLGLGRLNSFKVSDATSYQFLEGFDYLGLGVILLSTFAIVACLGKKRPITRIPFWGAILVIVISYLLALSTTLTLGHYSFHIPGPGVVDSILSRLRASGRLFWVAGFWIVLLGIAASVARLGIQRGALFLTALLVVQIVDIQPIAFNIKMSMASGETQKLQGVPAGHYAAILAFPGWECDNHATPLGIRNYESIGFFAIQHNIPTNNFYAGRDLPEQIAYQCDYSRIAERLVPDGIYLFSDKVYKDVEETMSKAYSCNNESNGDGSWLCVPRRATFIP